MGAKKEIFNYIIDPVRIINLSQVDKSLFNRQCVGCLVLSQDKHIILQQRDEDALTFPGCLATFGGGMETNETPMEALVRELQEELGAIVNPSEVISLGVITEEQSNHEELIYTFFWHDKLGTLTGCYEGKMELFNDFKEPFNHPNIMEDVKWILMECKIRQLL